MALSIIKRENQNDRRLGRKGNRLHGEWKAPSRTKAPWKKTYSVADAGKGHSELKSMESESPGGSSTFTRDAKNAGTNIAGSQSGGCQRCSFERQESKTKRRYSKSGAHFVAFDKVEKIEIAKSTA